MATDRCNSEELYTNCLYYVVEAQRPTIRRPTTAKRDRAKVYVPIHAIPPQIECQCPECTITATDNGFRVAYCKILDRHLTKYEVYQCSRYWKECPYRYL